MIIKRQEQAIYCEKFSLKIASKSCNKGLKYCKFTRKRNRTKHVVKEDHSKISITTKYIEYKHKSTGTSSCKSVRISKLQYFN